MALAIRKVVYPWLKTTNNACYGVLKHQISLPCYNHHIFKLQIHSVCCSREAKRHLIIIITTTISSLYKLSQRFWSGPLLSTAPPPDPHFLWPNISSYLRHCHDRLMSTLKPGWGGEHRSSRHKQLEVILMLRQQFWSAAISNACGAPSLKD